MLKMNDDIFKNLKIFFYNQNRNKKIPMLSGRPAREKIINQDDIDNLKILLNTCDSFETLIWKM